MFLHSCWSRVAKSCLRSVNWSQNGFPETESVSWNLLSLMVSSYLIWGLTWTAACMRNHDLRGGGPKPTCLLQGQYVSAILEQQRPRYSCIGICTSSTLFPWLQSVNPAPGLTAVPNIRPSSWSNFVRCNISNRKEIIHIAVCEGDGRLSGA